MVDLPHSSIGARFRGAGLGPAVVKLFRAWRNRRSARALLAMNARELADIGLTPSDVQLAFGLPFDQDPTELLANLARERRAARLARARQEMAARRAPTRWS